MATITCRDCGAQRTQVPRNTRYCWLCRLLRDIDYWRTNTRRCPCGRTFAPLRRTDTHCSTCDPGLRAHSGTCVLCRSDGRFTDRRLPACVACARDPKQRPALIRALERGQAKRRAANPPPPPEEVPSL